MPVSFLPSLRSRQSRGANFSSLNSPNSGAPGAVAPSAPPSTPSMGAPLPMRGDGGGGEGTGGGGMDPNTTGYGKTDSLTGMLGGVLSPGLAALGMVNNPQAATVGASLWGGKPSSLTSKISDTFDPNIVNPNVAAPGKATSAPDLEKADFSAKAAGPADLGKADFSGTGVSGGATTASPSGPESDPGSPAGMSEGPNSGQGQEGGSKGDTAGTETGQADSEGAKARTGAYLPPGMDQGGGAPSPDADMGAPPGMGGGEPQPVPVEAHTGEFILRPEITQVLTPELLTAVNSGIIPPDMVRAALTSLLEMFDPTYNDGSMPVAGPNGTMMGGDDGSGMGMDPMMGGGDDFDMSGMGEEVPPDMGMGGGEDGTVGYDPAPASRPAAFRLGAAGPSTGSMTQQTAGPMRQEQRPASAVDNGAQMSTIPPKLAYRSGGYVEGRYDSPMKTIDYQGERKGLMGAQGRQRWRDRGEMAPPGPDAAGGGDAMEDRINAPKQYSPYRTGYRPQQQVFRGGGMVMHGRQPEGDFTDRLPMEFRGRMDMPMIGFDEKMQKDGGGMPPVFGPHMDQYRDTEDKDELNNYDYSRGGRRPMYRMGGQVSALRNKGGGY